MLKLEKVVKVLAGPRENESSNEELNGQDAVSHLSYTLSSFHNLHSCRRKDSKMIPGLLGSSHRPSRGKVKSGVISLGKVAELVPWLIMTRGLLLAAKSWGWRNWSGSSKKSNGVLSFYLARKLTRQ